MEKREEGCQAKDPACPPPVYPLGFRLEEFGSSGSAGSCFSNHLPAYFPQREAREEITPEGRRSKTISPREFLLDRPDPMEEKPPQDDDPNFSSLNPKSLPLSPPGAFSTKGPFFKNRGGKEKIRKDLSPPAEAGAYFKKIRGGKFIPGGSWGKGSPKAQTSGSAGGVPKGID
jgi:hypothetical protein